MAEDLGPEVASAEPLRDLFGDLVRLDRRKRGRPPHEATAENRQKVTLWLIMEYDDEQIAGALGITTRTLGKHYFHELSGRRSARMKLEAKNLAAIVEQVEKGNASAQALLDKKIERWKLGPMRPAGERGAKPPKLGKKELARIDARGAGQGTPFDRLIN